MNVFAYLNHSKWVVDCPKCGKEGATLAENRPEISQYWTDNNEYICPKCYPGMISISGKLPDGKYQFNRSARDAAMAKAAVNDEIYTVEFPDERWEIMKLVEKRPPENRNWIPCETLDFLKQENTERGIE
jgi:hypothetical protein